MSDRLWDDPRFREHLPFAFVALIALLGFLRVALQHWREGAALVSAALLVAAVLRVTVPEHRAGLLALRTRAVDVALYGGFGVAIGYVALTIEGGPFG
ncbi:DUF3017 domain-containing protein [Salinifilum aidingensis]